MKKKLFIVDFCKGGEYQADIYLYIGETGTRKEFLKFSKENDKREKLSDSEIINISDVNCVKGIDGREYGIRLVAKI